MKQFLRVELNKTIGIMEVLLDAVVPEVVLNVVSSTAKESAR